MYTRFFSCMFKSWELDLICIWFQPITIPDVTFSFLANHIARLHLNLRCYPITNARDFVKSLALIHYKCFWVFFLYSFCESYLHFDMHECIWYKMQYWAFIFVEIFSQFREKSVCICTRKNEAIFNKTLHFVFFLCSVSCFFFSQPLQTYQIRTTVAI